MCFPPTSTREWFISVDVLDLLILKFKRVEVETTLWLVYGFFQVPIEPLLGLPKIAQKYTF